MANDRVEQNDLAGKYPERVLEMSARWHELAVDTDRLPTKQAKPVRAEPAAHTKGEWHKPQLYKDWKMPQF